MTQLKDAGKIDIKAQAQAELDQENAEAAKITLKSLLKKKQKAQLVLANIDREIKDCEAKIAEGQEVSVEDYED